VKEGVKEGVKGGVKEGGEQNSDVMLNITHLEHVGGDQPNKKIKRVTKAN